MQLFFRQTLRAGAKFQAPELQQQMTQPVILCQQDVPLRDRRIKLGECRIALRHHRQQQRLQCFNAVGQALHVVAGRIHHATNPTRQQMV